MTSEAWKKYEESVELERYGYTADIPLNEAVRLFNAALSCDASWKKYPQLTEDEVVAAIMMGINDNGRRYGYLVEKEAFGRLQKIG